MAGYGMGVMALASRGAFSGVAGAGGAAAAIPVAGLVLGAAFAVMGVIQQRNLNEAIRQRAMELQRRIDKQITNERVNALDAVRRRSAVGSMAVADARNRFGPATGLSVWERLASLSADMTADTDAIDHAMRTQVESLQMQKLDTARGGEQQQRPVAQAGIEGFAQGFGIGTAFDTSLAQLGWAQSQSKAFNTYAGIVGGINATTMMAYPRTFATLHDTLSRTRADSDLKLDLSSGIESFLNTGGRN